MSEAKDNVVLLTKFKDFVICSTVTKSFYKEFLLLKFSVELFHTCKWVISCDLESCRKLEKFNNVETILNIKEEGDHVSGTDASAESFVDVVMTKFDSCRYAIDKYGYGFFLDCDMIVVNPFAEKFFKLLHSEAVDMVATPHYADDFSALAHTGYYNVGMFSIRDREILEEWKLLTKHHKILNLYYEQKPQEFISRDLHVVSLPFNYNLGWWRFRRENVEERLKYLRLENDSIYIGEKPAVNFHVHMLKEFKYVNNGEFLKSKILDLMARSTKEEYIEILKYYKSLL